MTGWRAKLGLIIPSSNSAAEIEFNEHAPEGASVHAARMALNSVTPAALDAMSDRAVECAELLSDVEVDVIAYACTTGSLLHGPGFDVELEEALSEAADCPAVTTARSVRQAFKALDVERIAVRTPYTRELNEREREYFEAAGIEIASIEGRGIEENTMIGALDPADAYRQVRSTVDPGAVDAAFISCTNHRTLPVIEPLEADLGMPVVSSNQVTLWDACRAAGVTSKGPGRLFKC